MAQQRGLWSWLFQRITGAYLVSARLQHAGWLVFDLLLLLACVYHGFNGLWSILADFNPSEKLRRGIAWGLALFGLVWIAYGVFVLVPFAK